jgi:hypothetical protein
MEGEEKSGETPEAFLARLGKRLARKQGVDQGLADILKTHLLKVAPAQDAAAQAKVAILKLARERASTPKADEAGG